MTLGTMPKLLMQRANSLKKSAWNKNLLRKLPELEIKRKAAAFQGLTSGSSRFNMLVYGLILLNHSNPFGHSSELRGDAH
jgi:hypothetical protein